MSIKENMSNDVTTDEDRPVIFETPESCCTPEDCCGQGEEHCKNKDNDGCCTPNESHRQHHGHHRHHEHRDDHRREGQGRRHRDDGEREYGQRGRRTRAERRAERDEAIRQALTEHYDKECQCGSGGVHVAGFLLFSAGVFAIGYVVGNASARNKAIEFASMIRSEAATRHPQIREHLANLTHNR